MPIIKPPKPDEKPTMKDCRYCRQSIDARAIKCAYCTSELAGRYATV